MSLASSNLHARERMELRRRANLLNTREDPNPCPDWLESSCAEGGGELVAVGKEIYYLSGDGLLIPAMKDQPPPDLRYFKEVSPGSIAAQQADLRACFVRQLPLRAQER
jgi:hypothetical protein